MHTPGQLASAGSLFVALLGRTPPPCVPRACALLATSLRGAGECAPSHPQTATEIAFVCTHAMDALCGAYGRPAPEGVVPGGACTSIQKDTSTQSGLWAQSRRLLATGAGQDAAHAEAASKRLRQPGAVEQCASSFMCIQRVFTSACPVGAHLRHLARLFDACSGCMRVPGICTD